MIRRHVLIVALLAGTIVASAAARTDGNGRQVNLQTLPYAFSTWRGSDAAPIDEDTARILAADAYLTRNYAAAAGAPVGLYLAFYGAQRPGASIHSPLHCLPGTGWEPLDVGTIDVASANGSTSRVRRMVIRKNVDSAVVLYWYAVHGRTIANEFASKWWLLHDALTLRRSDATLVRILVPVEGEMQAADQRAAAFAADLLPFVSQFGS